MKIIDDLKALNREQRATFIASLLGWTLDAFDYFLMVFAVVSIAATFKVPKVEVVFAITLTLMCRPLGALVFGRLAERFGRRPVLMANILLFSFFAVASAFAPNLIAFLILRGLFGFAMGGEWGIGASLVMESIPSSCRGTVSGILQQGYPLGYLLASVVYGLFFEYVGWRGLFLFSVLPALLVVYIRRGVRESPVWQAHRASTVQPGIMATFAKHWKLSIYAILLMAGFNWFSHGTQDLHPTFLQSQHKLAPHIVSAIAIAANIGAIIGGITFGVWSQRIGRRKAIIIAVLMALPVIPLWAYAATPFWLGAGAFLLQIAVQGAWGVIPAHLSELSPRDVRATFPGFTYQFGNFLAAPCATIQAGMAQAHGGNYSLALSSVTFAAAILILVMAVCGGEAREADFGHKSDSV